MRKPTKSNLPVVQLRFELEAWKELAVLAEVDRRSLPAEALEIIHKVFIQRFPKGVMAYLNENPNSFIANMNNQDAENSKP